jgi:hypothetical protein
MVWFSTSQAAAVVCEPSSDKRHVMTAMPTAGEWFWNSIIQVASYILSPSGPSSVIRKLDITRRNRNLAVIVTFGVVFLWGVMPLAAQSWSNGYARRRSITIDHTKVPNTDQSNFPVLISGTLPYLATTANGGYVTNANGFDIIFTSDAAGTTTLPFEQESYNGSTGTVNYWVQVPTVSHTTDTVIYLFYGNSSISTDQSNKSGVWDSNYVLVSHLSNNAGNTTVSDSTSNGNNLTNQSNTSNKTAAGAIGNGLTYNGSSDYSSIANNTSLNIQGSTITLEVWAKPTNSTPSSSERLLVKEVASDADPYVRYALWRVSGSSQVSFGVSTGGSGSLTSVTGGSLLAGGWSHLVGVYDGTSVKLFINGSQVNTASETGNIAGSTTPLVIGADTEISSEYFNGVADEARISNSARSADWIATEYNNQSTPSVFYTIGAEASGGPNLTSLSRVSGASGTAVTLTGTNFGSTQGGSTVTFNGTSATVSSWSATSITAAVPSGATTGSVVVTASSIASNGIKFIVTTGYANRRSFTIDHTKIPNTDQVNFPVLISGTYSYLATTANGGNVTSSNGYDIIFTSDAAGLNVLPFEQESYNSSTGAVAYWVQVPLLSHTTDTVIYMSYGNSGVASDQSNAGGVWDSNFKAVWHLPNGTTLSGTDSSSNAVNGTNSGMTATAGLVDGAASGDGGNGHQINTATNPYASSTFSSNGLTLSAWVKPVSSSGTTQIVSLEGAYFIDVNAGKAGFEISGSGSDLVSSASVPTGSWTQIVGTSDSSGNVDLYVNGTLDNSSSQSFYNLDSLVRAYSIGGHPTATGYNFDGVIDEVKISNLARSADWIASEYNNQSSPSTFYSVGAANIPSISTLSPSSGAVGTSVTIAGLFFGSTQGSSTVNFNGTTASVTSWSDTSINVSVPSGATSGNVVVTASGVTSNPAWFTVPGTSSSIYSYSYSRRITIDHTKVPHTDQLNFPVLVSGTYSYLATTANGGNVTNSNGYDIIFTSDPAGTDILPFEQESYNATTGAVVYWVKLPLVSHTTDTMFYIFYGNSAITSDLSNKTGLWDSTYAGVWHLPNGSGLGLSDSTENGNNGTNNGATATTGQIDGAASFNGSTNITLADTGSLDITSNVTIEAWVKTSATGDVRVVSHSNSSSPNNGYEFGLGNQSAGKTDFWNGTSWESANTAVNDNTWHAIAISVNGSTENFYRDGAADGSVSGGTPSSYSGTGTLGLNFNGTIDEIRLSNVARSADWLATEYNNQSSPSTFYSIVSNPPITNRSII